MKLTQGHTTNELDLKFAKEPGPEASDVTAEFTACDPTSKHH